ncbi:MAG: hypothetical protein HRT88_00245 [Lentisphaeraceae bacterium]|nr:hypothetical protein [Lentisphaeraceae bacterium]
MNEFWICDEMVIVEELEKGGSALRFYDSPQEEFHQVIHFCGQTWWVCIHTFDESSSAKNLFSLLSLTSFFKSNLQKVRDSTPPGALEKEEIFNIYNLLSGMDISSRYNQSQSFNNNVSFQLTPAYPSGLKLQGTGDQLGVDKYVYALVVTGDDLNVDDFYGKCNFSYIPSRNSMIIIIESDDVSQLFSQTNRLKRILFDEGNRLVTPSRACDIRTHYQCFFPGART